RLIPSGSGVPCQLAEPERDRHGWAVSCNRRSLLTGGVSKERRSAKVLGNAGCVRCQVVAAATRKLSLWASGRPTLQVKPPRFCSSAGIGGADDHVQVEAGGTEHVDEGVDAEEVDLASDEVGDPGLRDAESASGLGLGQALLVDVGGEFGHEGGPDLEVLSFDGLLFDGVPYALVALGGGHRFFVSSMRARMVW